VSEVVAAFVVDAASVTLAMNVVSGTVVVTCGGTVVVVIASVVVSADAVVNVILVMLPSSVVFNTGVVWGGSVEDTSVPFTTVVTAAVPEVVAAFVVEVTVTLTTSVVTMILFEVGLADVVGVSSLLGSAVEVASADDSPEYPEVSPEPPTAPRRDVFPLKIVSREYEPRSMRLGMFSSLIIMLVPPENVAFLHTSSGRYSNNGRGIL
jgi:hypothetical protein